MTGPQTAYGAATSRSRFDRSLLAAGVMAVLYGLPDQRNGAFVADPPVWAPIAGFPAAFVPLAPGGFRLWDKDGPAGFPP